MLKGTVFALSMVFFSTVAFAMGAAPILPSELGDIAGTSSSQQSSQIISQQIAQEQAYAQQQMMQQMQQQMLKLSQVNQDLLRNNAPTGSQFMDQIKNLPN
ncbi:MAG: hypothetical protein ACOZEN_07340 [Thermodesulfobacteriota bacterium]